LTVLFVSHDKTGYRIAYVRNWVESGRPFLYLPHPHVIHIMVLFYI